MQKSTTVFSVSLAELDEQLSDVASWPSFLPELEAVTPLSAGRYTFTVRQHGRMHLIDVAVRRSPHGTGMLWTVVDGPAWNGHLHLQEVDGRRTRVHLELNIERRSSLGHVVEMSDGDAKRSAWPFPLPVQTPEEHGLVRLQDVVARHGQHDPRDGHQVIQIPA